MALVTVPEMTVFGARLKFRVAVCPLITDVEALWGTNPEILAVTVYVPASRLPLRYLPAASVIYVWPLITTAAPASGAVVTALVTVPEM